jgi:hypothetical protein
MQRVMGTHSKDAGARVWRLEERPSPRTVHDVHRPCVFIGILACALHFYAALELPPVLYPGIASWHERQSMLHASMGAMSGRADHENEQILTNPEPIKI